MRRYEVVFVLVPSLTEDEVQQAIETYCTVAKGKGAEVVSVDPWGKRKLAFPVNKHTEGYYTILTLDEAAGEAVEELERRFKVSDTVFRFLTVRVDEEQKRARKFEKRRELLQKRKARKRARETKEAIAERE